MGRPFPHRLQGVPLAPTADLGLPCPGSAVTYGPPTTSRMDGAGGPFNDWDCKIANAIARGDVEAARGLQAARARIAIAFEKLEPVWVPTEAQLMIGGMLRIASVDGVCTIPADEVPMPDDGLCFVERIAPGRVAL